MKKTRRTEKGSPPAKNGATLGVKKAALELMKGLPEDCSWDDVLYCVYVRRKIEAGIKDADAGRLFDHDEVFREFEE